MGEEQGGCAGRPEHAAAGIFLSMLAHRSFWHLVHKKVYNLRHALDRPMQWAGGEARQGECADRPELLPEEFAAAYKLVSVLLGQARV